MSGQAAKAGRSGEDRLAREIEHGRKIAANAESVWFWGSPAGRRRADRRAELFVEHGGLAPGKRALEIGCGTGVFLERVARSGASLHGLDLSDDLLEKARARAGRLRGLGGRALRLLHPSIPQAWVEHGLAASRALERLPLVREIAGSMLMRGRRA